MKTVLLVVYILVNSLGLSGQAKNAIYFDTTKKKYFFCDNDTNKYHKGFSSLTPLYVDSSLIFNLRDSNNSLLVSTSEQIIYEGDFDIQNILRLKLNTYGAIVKKNNYFGFVDLTNNKIIEPFNKYSLYSFLKNNNNIGLIDFEGNEILLINRDLNQRVKYKTYGKPYSVHNDYLLNPHIYYYYSEYPYKGLFDINKNTEILYDKISNFLQINDTEILIQKTNGELVIYNLKTGDLSKSHYSSIQRIIGSNKRYIAEVKGEIKIVDENLREIPFNISFQKIFFINEDCYLVKYKDSAWFLVNKIGERINADTQFDEVVSIKNTLWGRNKDNGLFNGIYPNLIKDVVIHQGTVRDINIKDSILIIKDGNRWSGCKIINNKCKEIFSLVGLTGLQFTRNSRVLISESDHKFRLIDNKGNYILKSKFDFILSLNEDIFLVLPDDVPFQYLVDSRGKEFRR